MKNIPPNQYRLRKGFMASDDTYGMNGMFLIPKPNHASKLTFTVISGMGLGWEHVSVSLPNRTPTWDEMCFIKSLFWGPDECVIQYHPPESQYVNQHKHCLHLWKPMGVEIPLPPMGMV